MSLTRGKADRMDDKTRILTLLVRELASTSVLATIPDVGWSKPVRVALLRKPQKGDLVVCATSPLSHWTVAVVHEARSDQECVLREIGSERLCRMGNERFYVLANVAPADLFEGKQQEFHLKVRKAFDHGNGLHVFGGLEFDGGTAAVTVRERFGGLIAGKESVPYVLQIPWRDRPSIKKIVKSLLDAGWMTREFELRDREPHVK